MFLTSKNDLLYDSKNFDKYRNIYAIMLNKRKKAEIDNTIANLDDDLHSLYITSTYTLKLYFLFQPISGFDSMYKIIFGHYYNNQNMFLYKNTKDNKGNAVISYEVKHCNQTELLFNSLNKLIYSNSYSCLKRQLGILSNNEKIKYEAEHKTPIGITYNNATLNIKSNGLFSANYKEGNLTLINN